MSRGKRSPRTGWKPSRTWTPADQDRFVQHLGLLGAGKGELAEFLASERINDAVLAQARALSETGGKAEAAAAIKLLAPLLDPQTRGTNFADALLVSGDSLAILEEAGPALAHYLKAVALNLDRGWEYRRAGARLARHGRAQGGELARSALAALDQTLHVGTQKDEADFAYFFELALLQSSLKDTARARGSAYAALDAFSAVRKPRRASLVKARKADFDEVRRLAAQAGWRD